VTRGIGALMPEAAAEEAKAAEDLRKAREVKKKVEAVVAGEEQRAYVAARTAAEQEVQKLEGEGASYFNTLLQQLRLLNQPQPDLKAEALAKAQQPFIDLETRAQQMVKDYIEQSDKMVGQARSLVGQAMATAQRAQLEQARGFTGVAQQHMMQAHMIVPVADEARRRATNLHTLAEEINAAIPRYQQAGQMASAYTWATFKGL